MQQDASIIEPKKIVHIGLAAESNDPSGIWQGTIKLGYLEEELSKLNYKAEWLGFAAAGPAVNEALVGGSIDLAFYGNLPPVTLKAKGFDVKIIAIPEARLNYTIITQPDNGITSPKDFEGKKVLVGKGTVYDEYWADLVKFYNIDENTVEIINDPANAVSIFAAKEADALLFTYQGKYLIQQRGVPFTEIESTITKNSDFASQAVLVGSGTFLEKNPDVAVAVIRAYIRAYNHILNEKDIDKIAEIFSTESTPKELALQYLIDNHDYLDSVSGAITDETIARLQRLPDFLASHDYIDNTYDINTLIDTSYYERALREVNGE